ncbi:class I SAM-dependent methyltransferase [Planktomarina temperata]|nr:class I SAM-dependent methyltransferase [Planktomarina temperata]
MSMKTKWTKAQTLEPLHWLDNKNKIASNTYQNQVRSRAEHIFKNIDSRLGSTVCNKNILEIGCGATPLAIFAKNGAVTLVDPLMNFYKEQFADVFPESTELVQAKAEELPFDDNTFDILVTRNTLDHVEDVHSCLQEMTRVLKPDGVAYIGMNVFAGPLLIYRTFRKDPEHPYTFSKYSFKELVNKHFATKYEIDNDPINGNHFVENEDKTWYRRIIRNIFLKMGNYKIVELYTFNKK